MLVYVVSYNNICKRNPYFFFLVGIVMYAHVAGVQKNDRVYCVLPLYHSSGSKFTFYLFISLSILIVIVTSSVTLFAGGTIVLGRKFSARRFWNDCVDYKVNVFTVSFIFSKI